MNKHEAKSLIASLEAGTHITINLADDLVHRSGSYKVLGTRRGRGKCGSLLLDLQSNEDDSLFTIGTPQSSKIVNFSLPDGRTVGLENALECNIKYDIDVPRAVALKEEFKNLLTVTPENGVKVVVSATKDQFSGTFDLLGARQVRGRFGQIVLTLRNAAGEKQELWSYRHSGIVTRVVVVGR